MIAVIFNPTARGDRAEGFRQQVARLSPSARLLPTASAGDATRLAHEAGRDGARIVVAAGGDGTVNEVVNGLAQLPLGNRPALGVLPLGTVNVFAKEIGLSGVLDRDWKTLEAGHSQTIDLAVARHAGGDRWFIQMAGAGLDSAAIARVQWRLKKRLGPLAYLWAGIGALCGPLPFIQVRGGPNELSGQLALIGNGRFYGGRVPVFPEARLDDGKLDLALLARVNVLSLIRASIALRTGRLLHLSGVVHQQAPEFQFEGPASALFQVEGDNMGPLPVRFCIEPKAIQIVIPRSRQEPAIDTKVHAEG